MKHMIPMRMLLAVLAALLMSIPTALRAQDIDTVNPRHGSVRLISQGYGDSVVVRIGVTTAAAWKIANRFGYRLERVKMDDKGNFDRKAFQAVTPAPMKPWPLEQWKAEFSTKADSDQLYPAIAAQMIYGKSAVPNIKGDKDMTPFIQAAQELQNRFSYALFAADVDARAAEASGLRYADRSARLNESYVYRCYVAGGDPTYLIDTAYMVVHVDKHDPPPPPLEFIADTGDGKIKLEWHHPDKGGYTAYYVYRSEDNGATFRRLTRSPVLAIRTAKMKGPLRPVFEDTNVVNYRHYRYQVRGITAFAELSMPAEVDAYSMDLTAPPSPIPDDPMQIGTRTMKIDWVERNPPGDLKGFMISRSSNSLSGFNYITSTPLPASTRSYTDNAAVEGEPYYIVSALDTAGNMSHSIVISGNVIDSTPPSMPTGLTGTMDTNGIVKLKWRIGPESNLIGYRVLWANDASHDFTMRTPTVLPDTVFTDTVTMHTQTPYVYYRLAAVNIRRAHSEMGPIYAVKRPDMIAPSVSVFTDVSSTDSSAELTWAHSRSEDAAKQLLFRRTVSPDNIQTDEWKQIASFDASQEHYSDRNVRLGTSYQYELISVDTTGNRSIPSPVIQARPYDNPTRPAVEGLRAIYDEKEKKVHVTWTYPDRPEEYYFIVYRSFDNRSIAQYMALDKAARSYDDVSVAPGHFTYAVKMLAKSGAESPLRDKVAVDVR